MSTTERSNVPGQEQLLQQNILVNDVNLHTGDVTVAASERGCSIDASNLSSLGTTDHDVSKDEAVERTRRDSTAAATASADIDYARWTLKKRPWRRRVTAFERIVHHPYKGSGTQEDPYQVTWIEDDEENPLNLSQAAKWLLLFYVSVSTLCVALASSAYSGATESIQRELGGSPTVITLGISLYVLGFAVGPCIMAPISEVVGRRNTYLVAFTMFTLWNGVACASQNLASLLVFRFLAGAFGSCPLTSAGGSIADVFHARDRGLAITIYASCPFLGPALGPITGGFLGDAAGWRWVMGMLTIYAGIVTVAGVFMHAETYAPVLLRQRAERLSRATGRQYVSKIDIGKDVGFLSMLQVTLVRPWLLLFHEPIVSLLCLYQAVVYAILYSFFAAFPIVFQQVRGWNAGVGGLSFLGILVGMMAGIAFQVIWVNPRYNKAVEQHGGVVAPPEARIPQALFGAPLLVIGLAGFSVTTFPSIHWFVPIMFSAPAGLGMVLIFISLQSYLIDAYLLYAASVMAAATVTRSILGAVFPILAPYMYHPGGASGNCPTESCGIHVGPAIATILALLFLPAPFYFYKHGASIRQRCKYAAEADKLLQSLMHSSTSNSNDNNDSNSKSKTDKEAPHGNGHVKADLEK